MTGDPMRVPAVISVLVLSALGTAACGASSGGDVVETEWNNPIDGRVAASVRNAIDAVPFRVHVPRGLGSPAKILVSPAEIPAGERQVAFLYETDRYGLVSVGEGPAVPPASEWEDFIKSAVADNDESTTHGSAEIVTLDGGASALVTTNEEGTHSDICWLDSSGTTEFCVLGPDLQRDDVVEIANTI
jgi:hypothetical protein